MGCPSQGGEPGGSANPALRPLSVLRWLCWPWINVCCVCFRNLPAFVGPLPGYRMPAYFVCIWEVLGAGDSTVTYHHGWRWTF